MSDTAQRLKAELGQLSYAEREDILRFLMVSLESDSDEEAEAAFDAELQRRSEEIRSGKALGIPAEQVFAELRKKYS